jgi:hypothetical protein
VSGDLAGSERFLRATTQLLTSGTGWLRKRGVHGHVVSLWGTIVVGTSRSSRRKNAVTLDVHLDLSYFLYVGHTPVCIVLSLLLS